MGVAAITGDRPLSEQARDAEFFDADALIVTGQRLADPPRFEDLADWRKASNLALIVGSGVTAENIADLLEHVDAVIVGSALKDGGVWSGPMLEDRVRAISRARERSARQSQLQVPSTGSDGLIGA